MGLSGSRREFLRWMASGAAAGVAGAFGGCVEAMVGSEAGRSGGPRRPNVVFIIADDQRWDMLSCMGNRYVKTPHLDRLAAQGCVFENAFTVSGVCSPSRAGFLTGKYAYQCGAPQIIGRNNTFLMQETPFPACLHEAGYYSAHIGKWHLGQGQAKKPGYDYWAGFYALGRFYDTRVWINGQMKQFKGYSDDILSQLAAEQIGRLAGKDEPFCIFLGLKAPHLPFSYARRYENYLEGTRIAQPDSIDEDYDRSGRAPIMKTNLIRARTFQGGIPMFGSWDKYIKSYYRASQGLDDAAGRVLAAIDQAGIAEDTVVIYTSDQGYTLGEHGMTEKHYAYEQVMRIPMIVRYPRLVQAGIRRKELVLNIDVAPTVLDLCGVRPGADMAGRSWRPLFEAGSAGRAADWREDFLFEYWDHRPVLPGQLAVRSQRYKLITYPGRPDRELYDLGRDPGENRNVIDERGYAGTLKEMEARLERLIKETGWLPRRNYLVNNCYVLGPVSQGHTEAVRERVFAARFDPEQVFDIAGERLEWVKIPFGEDGMLDFGAAGAVEAGAKLLVSFVIRRLSNRDPHVILDIAPARATEGYYESSRIWSCKGHNSYSLGIFSWYNVPLTARENVVRLVMDCQGPAKMKLTVNAPQGTVSLR